MKQRGEKIVALTAYDFFTAKIMDEVGVHLILVGDSVGMAVLGYEMLCGHVPFRGEHVMDILAQIVEREPEPLPGLVHWKLRDLVMASLRKNLYDRPQTMAEIVMTLTDVRLELQIRERARTA